MTWPKSHSKREAEMPLSLRPLPLHVDGCFQSCRSWLRLKAKQLMDTLLGASLLAAHQPLHSLLQGSLSLRGPLGPPTSQNSEGKLGRTRTEVWDELR